jgi:hypothetical protein
VAGLLRRPSRSLGYKAALNFVRAGILTEAQGEALIAEAEAVLAAIGG